MNPAVKVSSFARDAYFELALQMDYSDLAVRLQEADRMERVLEQLAKSGDTGMDRRIAREGLDA